MATFSELHRHKLIGLISDWCRRRAWPSRNSVRKSHGLQSRRHRFGRQKKTLRISGGRIVHRLLDIARLNWRGTRRYRFWSIGCDSHCRKSQVLRTSSRNTRVRRNTSVREPANRSIPHPSAAERLPGKRLLRDWYWCWTAEPGPGGTRFCSEAPNQARGGSLSSWSSGRCLPATSPAEDNWQSCTRSQMRSINRVIKV